MYLIWFGKEHKLNATYESDIKSSTRTLSQLQVKLNVGEMKNYFLLLLALHLAHHGRARSIEDNEVVNCTGGQGCWIPHWKKYRWDILILNSLAQGQS